MSNIHEASDDDLLGLATVAERDGDTRSHDAVLAEIKRRQEADMAAAAARIPASRSDQDIIREVAARYAPEMTGSPLTTEAGPGKRYNAEGVQR